MKNKILAAILGFFVIGLFYATGFTKKGLIYVIGLCVASWVLTTFISPGIGLLINIAGAYLGYKFAEETNNSNNVNE